MTCLRYRALTPLALLLALALTQVVWAEKPRSVYYHQIKQSACCTPASCPEQSYKIYSLDGLGEDASFGAWVAQTIPDVIATGTWKEQAVIRYYAPKNILVVSHTPEVQAKVEGFLQDMKKALPGKKKAAAAHKRTSRASQVIPAAYQEPSVLRGSAPVADSSIAYPVPAQAKPPKHLFHFIIRYEGEGLVDDNIVKAMKAYYQGEKKVSEVAAPSAACAPATAGPVPSGTSISTSAPAATLPEAITGAAPAVSEKKENKEDRKEEKKESTKEKNKDEESSEQPWYFYSLR